MVPYTLLCVGFLALSTAIGTPSVPLQQDVSKGRRITAHGIERWAYVVGHGRELSFEGNPFDDCELVFSIASLSEKPAAEPLIEVLWRESGGLDTSLIRWPTPTQYRNGWENVRVPMRTRHAGTAIFRLVPDSRSADSVAVVAPRLQHKTVVSASVTERPNIVLIVFDTYRFDHVSRYCDGGVQTPNIDSFLDRSLEFTEAYSRSTYTLPSHVTMFTGLKPRGHGIRKNLQIVPADVTTIHQLLYQAGYRTGAFFEIAALKEPSGFPIGFDCYVESVKEKALTLDRISGWLQTVRDEPIFLFVNLATAHVARSAPADVWQLVCSLETGPEYRFRADSDMETITLVLPPGDTMLYFRAGRGSMTRNGLNRDPLSMALWTWSIDPAQQVSLTWRADALSPEKVEYLVFPPQWTTQDIVFHGETEARIQNAANDTVLATLKFRAYPDFSRDLEQDKIQYALSVATLDSIFGNLVTIVEQVVDPRSVLWIVTSDHGEGLEDHRDRLHGHEVYEETTHVPLAIRWLPIKPGKMDGLVPLDCIASTILSAARVEMASGMSNVSLLDGNWQTTRSLVSETFFEHLAIEAKPEADAQAIRTAEWSLIVEHVEKEIHLFNRYSDRNEGDDVWQTHQTVADSLMSLLERDVRGTIEVHTPGVITKDQKLINALRALGYVD